MEKKFFVFLALAAFFMAQSPALAAALPLARVDIFAKSISTRQVLATTTDEAGNFSLRVPEESGDFNIFIGDQNMTPVKISAQKNIVAGRIVILTESTTTKDKDTAPAVCAPEKKTASTSAQKAAPATKTNKSKINPPEILLI